MSCKPIALALMLLACTSLLGNRASAQESEPRYWDVSGVGPEDSLIVHSSGSVQSPVVGLLPADAICLKNLGCRGGLTQKEYQSMTEEQRQAVLRRRPRWCQISFGNRRGWVAQKFLVESASGCVIDRRI